MFDIFSFFLTQFKVTIIQCKDLPVMDIGGELVVLTYHYIYLLYRSVLITGSSDPYCRIYVLPDKKKKFETTVKTKCLDPIFKESFIFQVCVR